MSKKKNIAKMAKDSLKTRREDLISALDKLYKTRGDITEASGPSEDLDRINLEIDLKIEEISTIDLDLSRKDKKSSNIEWFDSEYKASPRGTGARDAVVVNRAEYDSFRDKKWSVDQGPQTLWLKPGILVNCKDREIPGIVVDVKGRYASVLFGGMEVNVRKLALRPADWDLE